MARPPFGGFYPITEQAEGGRFGLLEQARLLLSAGVDFFQVREKRLSDGELYRALLEVAAECRRAGARFVVNDRVDVAVAAGAAGVHLGQTDLPPEAARRLMGADAVIGLSTHSAKQLRQALGQPVDYVAVGPIFATATKKSRNRPRGLAFVRDARGRTDLPLVAIGGIGLESADSVWRAGADAVAVISDLWGWPDPARRARDFRIAAERRPRGPRVGGEFREEGR